jgi:hypothetical protein
VPPLFSEATGSDLPQGWLKSDPTCGGGAELCKSGVRNAGQEKMLRIFDAHHIRSPMRSDRTTTFRCAARMLRCARDTRIRASRMLELCELIR